MVLYVAVSLTRQQPSRTQKSSYRSKRPKRPADTTSSECKTRTAIAVHQHGILALLILSTIVVAT